MLVETINTDLPRDRNPSESLSEVQNFSLLINQQDKTSQTASKPQLSIRPNKGVEDDKDHISLCSDTERFNTLTLVILITQ